MGTMTRRLGPLKAALLPLPSVACWGLVALTYARALPVGERIFWDYGDYFLLGNTLSVVFGVWAVGAKGKPLMKWSVVAWCFSFPMFWCYYTARAAGW